MSMFGFPLLLIPLAVVNIIAFLMPGVSIDVPLYAVPLPSGVSWTITFAEALLAFSMLLMFFEAAKTVRPNGKYLTDHRLDTSIFGPFVPGGDASMQNASATDAPAHPPAGVGRQAGNGVSQIKV